MASTNAQRKRISKNTSQKKNTSKKAPAAPPKKPVRPEVKIFVTSFILLVLFLSYYTPVFGIFGGFIKNFGLAFFGFPAYIIPIYLTAIFVHRTVRGTVKPFGKIYVCAAGITVLLSCILTINASYGEKGYISSFSDLIEGGVTMTDGGIFGGLGMPIMSFCGVIVRRIILIFFIIVLVAAATKFVPIILAVRYAGKFYKYALEKVREVREASYDEYEEEYVYEEQAPIPKKKQPEKPLPKEEKARGKKRTEEKEPPAAENKKPGMKESMDINIFIPSAPSKEPEYPRDDLSDIEIFRFDDTVRAHKPEETTESYVPEPETAPLPDDTELPPSDDAASDGELFEDVDPSDALSQIKKPLEKPESTPASAISKKTDDPDQDKPLEIFDDTEVVPYEFPPITLLERGNDRAAAGGASDLRALGAKLIETLRSFGVEAKLLETKRGPSVTRFEIQPRSGIKVKKITELSDDIALNLAAISVRIEAPIPGKSAVGIEIPNSGNSIVRLRDVIDSPEFKNMKSKTSFAVGKDITGLPVIADIAKMPHALIAGATGSGKSVCVNSLITSILYKADPNEVKFIMIDPKVVELSVYNGIPHLLIPVVTDPKKAAGALNWAVQEMTRRYKLFEEANTRNLDGYNRIIAEKGEKPLERIVIIVDELADLMMVAPHDVEDAIQRLTQLARAAGMHLIVATQRPSVNVITGVIKANIPTRIAFAVSSQIDSRTILDGSGAEKLLGKGDMLFLPFGASKPTRVQGAFIDDPEVNRVVEFVKQQEVKYDEDVMEKIESGVSLETDKQGKDADEYLPRAIQIVVEAGQASASLLQSRLGVGYARARRLVEQLEARGIVGPYEGSKPRTVLLSRAEYAEMMMQSEE